MICNNCGIEIQNNTPLCPNCGASIQNQSNQIPQGDSTNNSPTNNAPTHETLEYVHRLKVTLSDAWKKYNRTKRYKLKFNLFIGFIVIVFLISGLLITGYIYIDEKSNYEVAITLIDEDLTENTAIYESEFRSAVLRAREENVVSKLISATNKSDSNEYMESLYKHPGLKIAKDNMLDKEYYLITNYLKLDRYNLLDTTDNAIYPGAIIKGDSLFKNNYTIIAIERAPITLMSNQLNGKSIEVKNPDYSTVTTALNRYASDYIGDTSKEWTHDLVSATTREEMNFSLGLGVNVKGVDFGFDFGTGESETASTVAIVYSQIYYTVSVEPKNTAADYFSEGADLRILGGNQPAYISSVDYGRKIILYITGNMSQKDLSAKIGAAVGGVSISAGLENLKTEEHIQMKVATYGGKDATGILKEEKEVSLGVIGGIREFLWGGEVDQETKIDRVNEFISDGSKLINPVPISYRLKYLTDNSNVPSMYINSETILPADNIQIVTLVSKDQSNFTVDLTSFPTAVLLDENDNALHNNDSMRNHYQILYGSNNVIPITIKYAGLERSIHLKKFKIDEKTTIPIFTINQYNKKGKYVGNTLWNVEISKTNKINFTE